MSDSRPAGSTFGAPTASMLKTAPTLREKARAQLSKLRPSTASLVDAGFTLVLVTLALVGLRTTFFGLGWLWVGLAGLVIGLLLGHLTASFRVPGIVTGLLVAAAYLLLGGPVATREDLILGFIPSGSTFGGLLHMAVPGWKEMLTALPPIDAEGPYLALPFLFALVGGTLTYAVARRWPGALAALVSPVALLVTSLLLGTLTAAAVSLQGALFALVAIGWAALRSNRNRPALQNGGARVTRAITTTVLLAVATVGGFFAGPLLPGADAAGRTVLRTGLVPPFDVTQFPSALAGFRQYTEPNPSKLFTTTLLTAPGLPAGVPVRFAALDSYDGYVWGAGNAADLGRGDQGTSFRKVGRHIAPADGVPDGSRGSNDSVQAGREVTATVTVPASGYSDVWLPTFGTVTGLEFGGTRADSLRDALRFNIDTNSGVLTEKLKPGDTYTVTAYVDDQSKPPANVATASGTLSGIDTESLNFVNDRLDAWTGRVDGSWPKVIAIAKALQDGAYTDGGTAGNYQSKFLAGHSLRRMTQFMKSTQLAGNDEQYASALALSANRIGIPTRVVMGAIPQTAGVVKGSDVHAWVEVRLEDGRWQPVLPSQFLPDRNKKPQQLIQKSTQKKTGAQVPPPSANNPPSVLQGPDQAQNATQLKAPPKDERSPLDPSTWPDWLRWLVFFLVVPLLVLIVVYVAIRFIKAVRRYRRRRKGTTDLRVSRGWREVIDTARDLRMPLPHFATRLEQAHSLEEHVNGPEPEKPSPVIDGALMGAPTSAALTPHPIPTAGAGAATPGLELVTLATSANGHVFDLAAPSDQEVQAFWADVATARKAIRRERGFWQKVRGDLSLRTFRRPPRIVSRGAAAKTKPAPALRGSGSLRGSAGRKNHGRRGERS